MITRNKKLSEVRHKILNYPDRMIREIEYLNTLFSKIYINDIEFTKEQFECVEKYLYERILDIKQDLVIYESLLNGKKVIV